MAAPALSQRIAARLEANRHENGYQPVYDTATWAEIFAAEDAIAAKQIAAEAKSLGLDTLRRRTAELERRVVKLELDLNMVAKRVLKDIETHNANLKTQETAEQQLADRIKALEERPAGMQYRGVWSDSREYTAGSVTSHKGAAWIATVDSRALVPGDGAGWTLIAKSDLALVNKAVKDALAAQMKANPTCR